MPQLQPPVRGGVGAVGGIVGYPLDQLREEVAYIAYYFHWPRQEILELEHHERRAWVEQIAGINNELNGERSDI